MTLITTYERNSIWKFDDRPMRLDAGAVDARERKVRLGGKVYRYQRVAKGEAIRLLRSPLGTLPVHRPEPPISREAEPLREALLRDLAGPMLGLDRFGLGDPNDLLSLLKAGETDTAGDDYRLLVKQL